MTVIDIDPRIIAMLDLLAEMPDRSANVDLFDHDGRALATLKLWAGSRVIERNRARVDAYILRIGKARATVFDMRDAPVASVESEWRPGDRAVTP